MLRRPAQMNAILADAAARTLPPDEDEFLTSNGVAEKSSTTPSCSNAEEAKRIDHLQEYARHAKRKAEQQENDLTIMYPIERAIDATAELQPTAAPGNEPSSVACLRARDVSEITRVLHWVRREYS
mmetsp:Transcript_4107/g.8933  ORF Transcript_4107/g.8933 Transcript_4107/m.8933 type:complete len:126 (-) Transcript_4107:7-384(-)